MIRRVCGKIVSEAFVWIMRNNPRGLPYIRHRAYRLVVMPWVPVVGVHRGKYRSQKKKKREKAHARTHTHTNKKENIPVTRYYSTVSESTYMRSDIHKIQQMSSSQRVSSALLVSQSFELILCPVLVSITLNPLVRGVLEAKSYIIL